MDEGREVGCLVEEVVGLPARWGWAFGICECANGGSELSFERFEWEYLTDRTLFPDVSQIYPDSHH